MSIGKGKPSWGVDIGAKAGEPAKADVCRAAAGGAIAGGAVAGGAIAEFH